LRGVRIGAATGDETQWIDEPEVCAVWCNEMQCGAMRCSVVQGGVRCGAGWCRVLQRGTKPSGLVKLRCVLCVAQHTPQRCVLCVAQHTPSSRGCRLLKCVVVM